MKTKTVIRKDHPNRKRLDKGSKKGFDQAILGLGISLPLKTDK